MAYQTGNASTITDLLSKLATFAEANDWVIDKLDLSTGTLFLHNSEGYWSFGQTTLNNVAVMAIAINGAFDDSLGYDKQPSSSIVKCKSQYNKYYIGAGTNFHSFPFSSYVFMGTSDYLHVVVRVDSRRFRHFGVGTLNKDGAYSGGQYAYGTLCDNEVDAARNALSFSSSSISYAGYGHRSLSVITFENDYYLFGHSTAGLSAIGLGDATINRKQQKHPDSLLVEASLSVFNNTITLVPMSVYAYIASKQYQRIGVVPNFYVARIDSVVPGTIQEINGEKFYCAAATMYQTVTSNVTNEDNSYDLGYFYRVVE